ncbi:hypothetical protein VSDKYIMU_CDS0150 [Enterococcus phage VRE9_4]
MNIIFQTLSPKREEWDLLSGAVALCLGPPVGTVSFCELAHRYALVFFPWVVGLGQPSVVDTKFK